MKYVQFEETVEMSNIISIPSPFSEMIGARGAVSVCLYIKLQKLYEKFCVRQWKPVISRSKKFNRVLFCCGAATFEVEPPTKQMATMQ
mmetsp:Transcript_107172/g.218676  ORF Transcript_107172/g.218676 Transcript_107172/m.218676 type:complete len:88 (+) Transcript_107172:2356-2619(+)